MNGARLPKQFLELGGKTIIAHTIDRFEEHSDIDSIVIACKAEWINYLEDIICAEHYQKICGIVPGGPTGQASIYNALSKMDDLGLIDSDSIVLVHDGVRPLIDKDTISACLKSAIIRGCTATVAPAVETILETDETSVVRIADRSHCLLARAPQGFRSIDFFNAHKQALTEGRTNFIDSISLMAHYGYPIYTVEGPAENIKITTPSDFFAFKGYMDMKEMEQLWGD